MATITEVHYSGRTRHDRFTPMVAQTSIIEAAKCECYALWWHAFEPHRTFCEWANGHQPPPHIAAAVNWAQHRPVCPGTNELVHEDRCDGDGVGLCPRCLHDKPTSPTPYEGWRTVDAHLSLVGYIR